MRSSLTLLSFILFFGFGLLSIFNYWQQITPIPTTVLTTLLCVFLLYIQNSTHRLRLGNAEKYIVLYFVLITILSTACVVFFSDYSVYNTSNYIGGTYFTRMINLYVLLFSFVILTSKINEFRYYHINFCINVYLFSCIALAFIGVWQFISFHTSIPFFDLELRTHMHSVDDNFRTLIPDRITSLANEPSYFAPLLIDALIIIFFSKRVSLFRTFVMSLLAFNLIFSFSGGGIVNLCIILFVYVILRNFYLVKIGKVPLSTLIVFVALIFIVAILSPYLLIVYKLMISKLFDSSVLDSVRGFEVLMPFIWTFDNSIWQAIFGHGPGSYSLLQYLYTAPNGFPVHVTSNSIYGDFVFEYGYFGLSLLIVFFVYLLIASIRFTQQDESRLYNIPFYLTVHLMISSLYRADFVTPRFWAILIFIIIILRLANGKRIYNNSCSGSHN